MKCLIKITFAVLLVAACSFADDASKFYFLCYLLLEYYLSFTLIYLCINKMISWVLFACIIFIIELSFYSKSVLQLEKLHESELPFILVLYVN